MPTINQSLVAASAIVASLGMASPAHAAVRVDSARADDARSTVVLRGSGFATAPALGVYLVGHSQPLAIVVHGDALIDATLPANLPPGSYEIVVGDAAAFAVTLGPVGPAGDVGAAGPAGAQGPAGAKGEAGEAGIAGATGAKGPTGNAGADGPAGPAGTAGNAGPTGAAGIQGPRGDFGLQGPRGPQGPPGSSPPLFVGPPGPRGPAGGADTAGQNGRSVEVFPGTFAVPHGAPAALVGIGYGPFGGTPTFGDGVFSVSAKATMAADWDGCELRVWLEVRGPTSSMSLPAYRHLPRGAPPLDIQYTVMVPSLAQTGFYNVWLHAASDCPATTLANASISTMWLNRRP